MIKQATILAVISLAYGLTTPSCGLGLPECPEEYPCCSLEGICGNGYVCLGGCDPRYSYEPGSCVAMPVYQSSTHNFQGTEGVTPYAEFLGNATESPFNYLGNVTTGDNNNLRVQLFQGTGGSTVSSSNYLWYGKTTLKMKTSGSAGVVSDFILLSSVKDEIDYEFVGYDLNNAQTNYYWHGNPNYQNMVKAPISSNSEENYHEYTIDWQEEQIQWIIDGNVVRTLKKSDTLNSTTGVYNYPQTPCRVQFGLWPGGDSDASGTSEWAGGKINWHGDQAADKGYFYADVESLTVEPYGAPAGTKSTGSSAYVYNSKDGMGSNIEVTDDSTVLLATNGNGQQLAGPFAQSSSAASSSSSASSSTASSSSASSSSAMSSSASSSSAQSSSASSSASASSASSSSASSASSASSRNATTSGDDFNSSASSGSGSSTDSGSGSRATSTSTATSSSGSSSATATTTKAKNGGVVLAVPAVIGAIIPAFLL